PCVRAILQPTVPGPDPVGRRHSYCCLRWSSGMADAGANDMMMISTNPNRYAPQLNGAAALSAWVNRVFSRGTVSIQARDPLVDPEIELNMLSDERDLVRLEHGLETLRAVLGHRAFAAEAWEVAVTAKDDLVRLAEET